MLVAFYGICMEQYSLGFTFLHPSAVTRSVLPMSLWT